MVTASSLQWCASHREEQIPLLTEELDSLLAKGTIELFPLPLRESGFNSRYFLVPKKDGRLRPVLDL